MNSLWSTPVSKNSLKLHSLSLSEINSNPILKKKTKRNRKRYKRKCKNVLNKYTSSESNTEDAVEKDIFKDTNNSRIFNELDLEPLSDTSNKFPSPECIRDATCITNDFNLSVSIPSQALFTSCPEKNYELDCALLPLKNVPCLNVDPIEHPPSPEGSIVIDHEKLMNCKEYQPPVKKKKVLSKIRFKRINRETLSLNDDLTHDSELIKERENMLNWHYSPKYLTHAADRLWNDFTKEQYRVPPPQHEINMFGSSVAASDTFSSIKVPEQSTTLQKCDKNKKSGKYYLRKCKDKSQEQIKPSSNYKTHIFKYSKFVNNVDNKPVEDQTSIVISTITDNDSSDGKKDEEDLVLVNKMCSVRENYSNKRKGTTYEQVSKKQKNKVKSKNEAEIQDLPVKRNLVNEKENSTSAARIVPAKKPKIISTKKLLSTRYTLVKNIL